jgi:hypothetical protein
VDYIIFARNSPPNVLFVIAQSRAMSASHKRHAPDSTHVTEKPIVSADGGEVVPAVLDPTDSQKWVVCVDGRCVIVRCAALQLLPLTNVILQHWFRARVHVDVAEHAHSP